MMYVTKYAINVVPSLTSVLSTKHGNAVLIRSPIIQKHLSAAKEVSVFCTIPKEVQRKPDAAVIQLFFQIGRFAAKVSFFLFPSNNRRMKKREVNIYLSLH